MKKETNIIDPQDIILPSSDKFPISLSTEANYERWAFFLFPPKKNKNTKGRKRKEWEIKSNNGKNIAKAIIEVIPAQDSETYTTRTYDVYLAILSLWQDRGMPDEVMNIYLGDIAKKLELKENGRVNKFIVDELKCLEETKVSWIFSFQTTESEIDTFQNQRILDTFNYTQRKDRLKGVSKQLCEIRISEHIRNNFHNKFTVPVNFSVRKQIKSSTSRCFYSRIDSILCVKAIYKRTGLGVISDYYIESPKYKYKSKRKELLYSLKKNLEGKELSLPGLFLHINIEESSDKLDWIIVCTTVGTPIKKKIFHLPIINADKNKREHLIDKINQTVGGKKENYGLYNTFALYYSEDLISRALGEYKEIINVSKSKILDKKSYFTSIIHLVVHKKGLGWIKECNSDCRYRPENQLKI